MKKRGTQDDGMNKLFKLITTAAGFIVALDTIFNDAKVIRSVFKSK